MDLDTEKLLAKVSGKNVENFSKCVISDASKAQIDFAFNQMFSGLSLLQWMESGTLTDAWRNALDKMRDFIFSLPGHNYITDYLYHAVFDFRKDIEKNVFPSVHANEYYNGPTRNIKELKVESEKKVKQGIDIIMNLISEPNKCYVEKHNVVQKEPGRQKIKEREYEHERTRK